METAAATVTVKLTKGTWGDRYNIKVNGVHVGWTTRPTTSRKEWGIYLADRSNSQDWGTQATRAEAVEMVLYWQTRVATDIDIREACDKAYRQIQEF